MQTSPSRNRYKNPWHDPSRKHGTTNGPAFYEHTDDVYKVHRGVTIFKRHNEHYDCVIDGVCIAQLGGFSKTNFLDAMLDGDQPVASVVAEHLRANGFPLAKAYNFKHEIGTTTLK